MHTILYADVNARSEPEASSNKAIVAHLTQFLRDMGYNAQIWYLTSFAKIEAAVRSAPPTLLVTNFPPNSSYDPAETPHITITGYWANRADSYERTKISVEALLRLHPGLQVMVVTGAPESVIADDEIVGLSPAPTIHVVRKAAIFQTGNYEATLVALIAGRVSELLGPSHHGERKTYRKVLEFLNANPKTRVGEGRLNFVDDPPLGSSVCVEAGEIVVSVDSALMETLLKFNQCAPLIGVATVFAGKTPEHLVQRLFDDVLSLVFRVARIGLPSDAWLKAIGRDDGSFEEYREGLQSREGLDELPEAADPEWKRLRETISTLAGSVELVAGSAEMQFVWILLHECAHLILRHPEGVEATDQKQFEFEADRLASSLLLEYFATDLPRALITTTPLPCLFMILEFLGFIRRLVNGCVRYSTLAFLREPLDVLPDTHPAPIERARVILPHLPTPEHGFKSSINNLWATVYEAGLHSAEVAIVTGLVDLAEFKRYCRITAQQLGIAATAQRMGVTFAEIAPKFEIITAWDSADLRRGPLKREVFENILMEGLYYKDVATHLLQSPYLTFT